MMAKNRQSWRGGGGVGLLRRRQQAQQQMCLHMCVGWRRGSVAMRYLSVVRGDAVLLFLIPARARGGGGVTLPWVEMEGRGEAGLKSEEVK